MLKIRMAMMVIAILCSGCASILAGRSQNVSIETSPSDARCDVYRQDRVIATVEHTPGAVRLDKTKHDLKVVCIKDGYLESFSNGHSGNEGSTLGNIILGGGIGWAFDSAVGADNKYPDSIMINLATPPRPITETVKDAKKH